MVVVVVDDSLLQSAMGCYYEVRQLFYYKVRQILQSLTILLQSAIGITEKQTLLLVGYNHATFVQELCSLREK